MFSVLLVSSSSSVDAGVLVEVDVGSYGGGDLAA